MVSMFCGIGGFEAAAAGLPVRAVWSNDTDAEACKTFRANHPRARMVEGDVRQIDTKTVPNCDLLVAGFPCQSFSQMGAKKAFDDPRGHLVFEVVRFLHDKHPKLFMLENVKNLVLHDGGRTLERVLQPMRELGYDVDWRVLDAATHGGIPQHRERVFIVGSRARGGLKRFQWPEPVPMTPHRRLLDTRKRADAKYHYPSAADCTSALHRDINADVTDSAYFYLRKQELYARRHESGGSVVRRYAIGRCPTLTAGMGKGGNNVPLVSTRWGPRKLTPRECARLQGFPDAFELPERDALAYAQLGNSVPVPLVARVLGALVAA